VSRGTIWPTELWSTDGTAAGTVALVENVPLPDGRNLYWDLYVYPVGDEIFFHLWDPEHGEEPWASDGTLQGTGRIADICPGSCNSAVYFRGSYGARALFHATDGVSGDEPWIAEVRPGGRAWRLGDLCPGDCNSYSDLLSTETGWIVYAARDSAGQELWVSDGSPDRAFQVSDFEPDSWLPQVSFRSVLMGDRLIFGYQTLDQPGALWSLTLPPPSAPPDPPPGDWIMSPSLPGFRIKGRITSGSEVRSVRSEPCLGETVCLSGAVPSRPELFVRVIGPRPNGYLWPTLVRFTTSQAEVWIEQVSTGVLRYYLLEAVPRDSDELKGLVDRTGFRP
jgi:ELWxxDGT repeat protein